VQGIYVLIIQVSKSVRVDVGALGSIFFKANLYAYVGSAQNSLEKRIERHLKKAKCKFWHADYLLDSIGVKVLKVFYSEAGKAEECLIAKSLGARGKPIVGFGSSDCKCKSHLFKIEDSSFLEEPMREL
jgi:Uri superfamily endonuclease